MSRTKEEKAKTRKFFEEQLQIALEALQKIAAVVEICPVSLRAKITLDDLVVDGTAEGTTLEIEGVDITKYVNHFQVKGKPGDCPIVHLAMKPKISSRTIKEGEGDVFPCRHSGSNHVVPSDV